MFVSGPAALLVHWQVFNELPSWPFTTLLSLLSVGWVVMYCPAKVVWWIIASCLNCLSAYACFNTVVSSHVSVQLKGVIHAVLKACKICCCSPQMTSHYPPLLLLALFVSDPGRHSLPLKPVPHVLYLWICTHTRSTHMNANSHTGFKINIRQTPEKRRW